MFPPSRPSAVSPPARGGARVGWFAWSGWLAALAAIALGLAGCSPAASGRADLKSDLFSRVEVWGTRGAAPGQFNKPRAIAVDRDDNVYVVDMTGRVQKFSSEGLFLLSWQMPQTDLGKPKGMTLDTAGLTSHLGKIVGNERNIARNNNALQMMRETSHRTQ